MSISPPYPFLNTGRPIKVWVLAPHLEQRDANIDYYYDFSQSIAEYEKAFATLGLAWQWQPLSLNNYQEIIETIADEQAASEFTPVVLNLCDGDEINGTPGISVLRYLEEKGLLFIGTDSGLFYSTNDGDTWFRPKSFLMNIMTGVNELPEVLSGPGGRPLHWRRPVLPDL